MRRSESFDGERSMTDGCHPKILAAIPHLNDQQISSLVAFGDKGLLKCLISQVRALSSVEKVKNSLLPEEKRKILRKKRLFRTLKEKNARGKKKSQKEKKKPY